MSRGGAAPLPDKLPLPVVDNHCHITYQRDDHTPTDVDEVLRAAAAVNVTRLVQVGCSLESAADTIALIEKYPQIVGAVALHPSSVPDAAANGTLPAVLEQFAAWAEHPRVRAIGETGLDYYWVTDDEGKQQQRDAFRWHIALAKRLGKPMQIHDRDAHADVLRVLEEEGAPDGTVFHCFSGDVDMAYQCAEKGYFLSFSGTVTFKNNRELRDALAATPLDKILVETDAPYLTPHPHRGSVNAPYMIPYVVRCMAETLSVGTAELCRQLNDNSERVYGPWE